MPAIISNTGPLIALSIIDRVDLLAELFTTVTVTATVRQEIIAAAGKPASRIFENHSWIQFAADPFLPDPWLGRLLDAGEATTLALALRENPTLVLIDERKGRRVAESIYGLPVIGTAGILLRAKTQGLIPAVRPLLVQLQTNGYHLRSDLIDRISAAAGE